MGIHLYWLSTITYAFVLGVLLYGERATKKPSRLEKSYHIMLSWVIFFCVQDTFWGLCEANVIKSDDIFFICTSIFHISTVVTTYFWLKYVLDYLGDRVKRKKLYLAIDEAIIGVEVIVVIINCYHTILFKIVDGHYVTGMLRPLTFFNQYIVYIFIGFTALFLSLKKDTKDVANYKTVFMFALFPILLGVGQFLYPEAPLYSLGYFLGCIIIHVFIVVQNREVYLSEEEKLKRIVDLNDRLEKNQSEMNSQYDILKSISGVYDYINLVDFNTKTAYRFDDPNSEEQSFDVMDNPHTLLNKKLANEISEEHYVRYLEYTDLSTLDEKMRGKKLIVDEFEYLNGDWIRAMYIRIGDNVDEPISKVAYALRNITSERKREQQIYSAMTHLIYSLHIFDLENDTMDRLIESDILKQIIGDGESAQKMINTVIKATCKDEYLDIMLEFVDLSTVSERMQGKELLNCEFVGKYHGWTRMTFIPIEMNGDSVKKLGVTTEIIESEKNEMITLIYKSSTDELTRLYNRRMYDEELETMTSENDTDNLVIVAMDLNGLKTVNDSIGHKAGDELIMGAGKCIKDSFRAVGKVYRTGGDEFMGFLRCDKSKLPEIFAGFEQNMEAWKGTLVDKLSISYGYVVAEDEEDKSLSELVALADKRMYEAKSAYYIKNGINRRRT